ncbi:MAG: NupC/NupG family nucleoside CNT transporter [Fimbriimonadaceae bacterium]|nr:NupC/NupG family nucleoside CNT transporter [Fimbriimonadaceae bacterium]QYK54688.1 MAG: NupC/NupG family nucleoside CNT transporter [Fimbriimonadaceae bacterium]
MERLISFGGLLTMLLIAWLLSTHRTKVSWRIVIGGLILQLVFAIVTLKTEPGQWAFARMGEAVNTLLGFVDEGSMFMFGINPRDGDPDLPARITLMRTFAFGVLPTIVFFSALMSLLYHLGVMQVIVKGFAVLMQRTLGTSGAETLSASANIFVGQTEAPLVVKPYLNVMTSSELMAVMVGGFATVAGGVMAAYVKFGVSAGHLLTASVISAPAALLIAKIMQPEVDQPKTLGKVEMEVERISTNPIEAVAIGATDGMRLAVNVGAMLIAFIALIACGDWIVGAVGQLFGQPGWTIKALLGYLFAPFALLIGVDFKDAFAVGQLLGTRTALNEFVAYIDLGELMKQPNALSERSQILATYALCGFCNFSSIGIQIGGIGALAPERRSDLARLGLRAMIGGTLACFMTACIAGILI